MQRSDYEPQLWRGNRGAHVEMDTDNGALGPTVLCQNADQSRDRGHVPSPTSQSLPTEVRRHTHRIPIKTKIFYV